MRNEVSAAVRTSPAALGWVCVPAKVHVALAVKYCDKFCTTTHAGVVTGLAKTVSAEAGRTTVVVKVDGAAVVAASDGDEDALLGSRPGGVAGGKKRTDPELGRASGPPKFRPWLDKTALADCGRNAECNGPVPAAPRGVEVVADVMVGLTPAKAVWLRGGTSRGLALTPAPKFRRPEDAPPSAVWPAAARTGPLGSTR